MNLKVAARALMYVPQQPYEGEGGKGTREGEERAHFMQSDKFRKILSSPINHAHSSALLRPIPQIWREEF